MSVRKKQYQTAGTQTSSGWTDTLGRAGYMAKGVVYAVIGTLTAQLAFGAGGSATGTREAIREIGSAPLGQVGLALVALGLACYATWRLILATMDPKHEGTDTEGVIKRSGFAVSGFANLALGLYAAQLLIGSGGGGGSSKKAVTAELMSQPYGLWIIGIIGCIVVGVGLYHFYRAANATFMKNYSVGDMDADTRMWAKRIGQWGLTARGIVFVIIGIFLVQAALQADPSETKGLGGALEVVARQPYGPWLLGFVALGLIAYAIYCFSYVRYRRFAEPAG
ncbi:hypothetical protein CRI94_11915 [Longibacter salinarum]|uniref:DUF1206 domain-containing protein n=1 Tax=Longibacter salinarum TaxID=1850348 RepID=A0A2A8CVV3_9BACT|nr:DUF1206 domain-containing protein [Longibacter salinarum]PEN12727.1 hypothetical protein CRI94_11915 [Longibacter salinarum]